jgi:hypothetical protein
VRPFRAACPTIGVIHDVMFLDFPESFGRGYIGSRQLMFGYLSAIGARGVIIDAPLVDYRQHASQVIGAAGRKTFFGGEMRSYFQLSNHFDLLSADYFKFATRALRTTQHKNGDLDMIVRRQVFWNQERLKQVKSLAHLIGLIMRRVGCDASVAFRASFF